MDERVEQVITKMDEIVDNYDSLYNTISKRFKEIESYQASMDSVLNKADSDVRDLATAYLNESKQKLDSITEECRNVKLQAENTIIDLKRNIGTALESINTEAQNSIKTHIDHSRESFEAINQELLESKTVTDNILAMLRDKYTKNVNDLISRISDKSQEILSIYEELENIRNVKQEIRENLLALEKDLEQDIQKVLGNFEVDSSSQLDRIKAIDVSQVQNFQEEQKKINQNLKAIILKLDENTKKTNQIEERLEQISIGRLVSGLFRKKAN